MLLSVLTTSDYNIHDLFSQPQTESKLIFVFQQKRTFLLLYLVGQKSQQKKLFWVFSKIYDQPDLVSII